MTDSINEPIAPDDLNPAPLGPLSGDWHDDDAAAYEGDFEAADHGPVKQAGVPFPVTKTPIRERLITKDATISSNRLSEPVMLFAPDVNRKSLTITAVNTTGALDTYFVGSTKSDVFNQARMLAVPGGITTYLDGFTGALWVYTDSANDIRIAAMAVTE